jgi:hypothetical protein
MVSMRSQIEIGDYKDAAPAALAAGSRRAAEMSGGNCLALFGKR